jgi:hypothetical protein
MATDRIESKEPKISKKHGRPSLFTCFLNTDSRPVRNFTNPIQSSQPVLVRPPLAHICEQFKYLRGRYETLAPFPRLGNESTPLGSKIPRQTDMGVRAPKPPLLPHGITRKRQAGDVFHHSWASNSWSLYVHLVLQRIHVDRPASRLSDPVATFVGKSKCLRLQAKLRGSFQTSCNQ